MMSDDLGELSRVSTVQVPSLDNCSGGTCRWKPWMTGAPKYTKESVVCTTNIQCINCISCSL